MHDKAAKAAGRKPESGKNKKAKQFNAFDDDDEDDAAVGGMHVPGAETIGLRPVSDRMEAAKKSTSMPLESRSIESNSDHVVA